MILSILLTNATSYHVSISICYSWTHGACAHIWIRMHIFDYTHIQIQIYTYICILYFSNRFTFCPMTPLLSHDSFMCIEMWMYRYRDIHIYAYCTSVTKIKKNTAQCPVPGGIASLEVQNLLLMDGRKFDNRIFVLVVSFDPLIILFHKVFV